MNYELQHDQVQEWHIAYLESMVVNKIQNAIDKEIENQLKAITIKPDNIFKGLL